jgi:HK97 family phage prohead protease
MTIAPTTVKPNQTPMREVRVMHASECRAKRGEKGVAVDGYAAKFNIISDDLGGFREVIRPGAFARAIAEKQDVVFLWMHDRVTLMARTSSGTMTISEDGVGLRFEARLADTQSGRDLATLIERGDVSSMSFAFRARKEDWDFKPPIALRTLIDVDLYDVSAVDVGAYPQTELGLRSMEAARAAVDGPATMDRLRRRLRLAEADGALVS